MATKNGDFLRKIPTEKSTTIWTDKSGNPKKYAGLIGKHSYAIIEKVEEGTGPMRDTQTEKFDGTVDGNFKFVWLQNPHATAGFEKYEAKFPKGLERIKIEQNGGKLKMELNDFLKYFRSYDILD